MSYSLGHHAPLFSPGWERAGRQREVSVWAGRLGFRPRSEEAVPWPSWPESMSCNSLMQDKAMPQPGKEAQGSVPRARGLLSSLPTSGSLPPLSVLGPFPARRDSSHTDLEIPVPVLRRQNAEAVLQEFLGPQPPAGSGEMVSMPSVCSPPFLSASCHAQHSSQPGAGHQQTAHTCLSRV